MTDAPSPHPLKHDVRLLTTLLGDIIREQEGARLFAKIERLRKLAKALREHPSPVLISQQRRLVRSLTAGEALRVARAFTIYFQLVNIAEERQRVRRIRAYAQEPGQLQEMSLRKLFHDLRQRHVPRRAVAALLGRMDIELVITAHPTEAKRRTVLDHLLRIAADLAELDRADTTAEEREALIRHIKETLEILWQTTEIRERKLSVLDEVDQALFYFQRTILDLVPSIHRRVADEYRRWYRHEVAALPPFLQFGSWVGADRDGNPGVTSDVTRQTAVRQQRLILKTYLAAIENLIRTFSQSSVLAPVSDALRASTQQDARAMPQLAKEMERFEAHEIYRKKLTFMYQKLEHASLGKRPAYDAAEAFIADLRLIQHSLAAHGGMLASHGALERLLCQAQTFGFALAKLDVRDHSTKIRHAAAELWPGATDDAALAAQLGSDTTAPRASAHAPGTSDILQQLQAIRAIQRGRHGDIVDDYIISMTEQPSDVLALACLAKTAGLVRVRRGRVVHAALNIVPLFEAIEALETCHTMLDRLLATPIYRSYLRARGDVQQVMLGYSDSSKDGGYLAANWKLYAAQQRLAEVATRHGIRLQLFHGKGGTIDRGGGESHKAIVAQPFAAADGCIKLTEQGEVVAQKYANAVIAERNLEQLISAVVWTNLVSHADAGRQRHAAVWAARMEHLADLSKRAYRALVFETPGFLEFYNHATPIRVLEWARIGSRPARRGASDALQELRAIPWVFSWIQSRYIVSAWYGIGHALRRYLDERGAAGLRELRAMYAGWPFFRSLINNAQISLAKTDLYIAAQYAELVPSKTLRGTIHGQIAGEYRRTVEAILQISGQRELLDFHPVLKESIRARNPYVDPLNYLQLRFLGEMAQERFAARPESERQLVQQILLVTVNGIAFGMKSTG